MILYNFLFEGGLAIEHNVSEYEKFLPASLLYINRRKGQKFGLRKICTPLIIK